jgi:hypothetical protein
MNVLDFLAKLATDTELMSAFRSSPLEALSRAGLTAEDQQLLLAGDPIALRRAVYAEKAKSASLPVAKAKAEEAPVLFPSPPPPSEPPVLFPTPPPPSEPAVLFPPPQPPSEPPVLFPTPPQPPSEPAVLFPAPPPPSEPPVEWPNDQSIARHDVEPAQLPLDPELDLAQDALLSGVSSSRAVDQDPSGVWSAKGLTVVGMGMRAGLHMTVETRLAIEQTSRVLYLVADPISEACILKLNPRAQSLGQMYESGKPRIEIYEAIIARILGELESAGDLCVAFYGHPGVLTYPSWESIRRARATGKRARMLPAISTEDALFADLGIDIGRAGLQSFEATRFLLYKYNFDPSAGLMLWQAGVLGENEWNPPHAGAGPRLKVLTDYLVKFYGPEHEVFLYHAPELPISRALVERVALRDLPRARFISISTLYIPPRGRPETNEENLRALTRMEV